MLGDCSGNYQTDSAMPFNTRRQKGGEENGKKERSKHCWRILIASGYLRPHWKNILIMLYNAETANLQGVFVSLKAGSGRGGAGVKRFFFGGGKHLRLISSWFKAVSS